MAELQQKMLLTALTWLLVWLPGVMSGEWVHPPPLTHNEGCPDMGQFSLQKISSGSGFLRFRVCLGIFMQVDFLL